MFDVVNLCDDCGQFDVIVRKAAGYTGLEYSQGYKVGTHQHRFLENIEHDARAFGNGGRPYLPVA